MNFSLRVPHIQRSYRYLSDVIPTQSYLQCRPFDNAYTVWAQACPDEYPGGAVTPPSAPRIAFTSISTANATNAIHFVIEACLPELIPPSIRLS